MKDLRLPYQERNCIFQDLLTVIGQIFNKLALLQDLAAILSSPRHCKDLRRSITNVVTAQYVRNG